MAYNKVKIFNQAKKEITEKKLIWIEEVVSFLPLNKTTFYDFFKLDSNELNELKALIEDNRTNLKAALRKKWFQSDAPALQMGLYKLLGSTDEAHRLNGSRTETDITTAGEKLPTAISIIIAPVSDSDKLPNDEKLIDLSRG